MADSAADFSSEGLPIQSYFGEETYRRELELLFSAGECLGHESLVPERGDYHVVRGVAGESRALVRGPEGIRAVSNVCRHRQALMLKGRGNAPAIVCPLHRWSYGLGGEQLGAPGFPENPCRHLGAREPESWGGFLFEPAARVSESLAGLRLPDEVDLSGYAYAETVVSRYEFGWKTFMEVYLEDYHVDVYHPGLGHFVDCADLSWSFAPEGSAQSVGIRGALSSHGSPAYREWAQRLLAFRGGKPPEFGAVWIARYPDVMIEIYPEAMMVSRIVPTGADSCENVVDFHYPREIALFEPELALAQREAYLETVREDDRICEAMQGGRLALLREGRDEAGPYQMPMERGMSHFHAWYRRKMGMPAG